MKRSSEGPVSPSESSVGSSGETSRMRIEMFSPCRVGTEARRRSTALPSLVSNEVRPSWGRRRSAMSMLPMILMRLTMPAWTSAGYSRSLCSTPSMRQRTCRASACGSTWMSEAFMLTASEMRPSTISMIEASWARAASSATRDSSSSSLSSRNLPRVLKKVALASSNAVSVQMTTRTLRLVRSLTSSMATMSSGSVIASTRVPSSSSSSGRTRRWIMNSRGSRPSVSGEK